MPVVVENLRVGAGGVLQRGVDAGEGVDEAAGAGPGGHDPHLGVAECLHGQPQMLRFLRGFDLGVEEALRAAGAR